MRQIMWQEQKLFDDNLQDEFTKNGIEDIKQKTNYYLGELFDYFAAENQEDASLI